MMKKFLQVTMTCLLIVSFAQNKEIIKLKGSIPNNGEGDYNTLIVIDNRKDKTIGVLPFGDGKEMKEVSFQNSPEDDFSEWYRKSNLKGGKQDLVLVLNDLKLSVKETYERKNIGTMKFSLQSFVKEEGKYHFLYKKDTTFKFSHRDVADVMVRNMHHLFSLYLEKTYKSKPSKYDLTLDDISNYQSYVNNYPASKNESLKEGTYLDYNSFFRQTPEEGYTLERWENGTLDRAVKTENGKKMKIPSRKMFIYVENGKAYKNTYSGFQELLKNEKGFYIVAKPSSLFPPQYDIKLGIMFGLAGGIADALLFNPNKLSHNPQEIYIDPMTGEYDFNDIFDELP